MTLYRVHKRFRAADAYLNPGDVVELEGRNLEALVSNRFISAAPEGAAEARVDAAAPAEAPVADLTSIRRKPGRPRKSE